MPQTFLTRAGALALWIADSAREGDNRARIALAGTILVTMALATGIAIQMTSLMDDTNPVGEIGRGQNRAENRELAGKPETIQDLIREMDADIDELGVVAREKTANEAFAMQGILDETAPVEVGQLPEDNPLEGRHDPFQPLVTTGETGAPMLTDVEPGPLDFIQYVGVIGKPGYSQNSGDVVAIIRVNDPVNNQSLVKRTGDTFSVNGQDISLRAIRPDEIVVKMGGEIRSIPMNIFVDTVTTSTANDAPAGDPMGNRPSGAGGTGAAPENFEELAE